MDFIYKVRQTCLVYKIYDEQLYSDKRSREPFGANKGATMWSVQACWALLLATSVLHRGHGAVLAEEKKEATEDWEGWPVYMEGCYLAFLDGGMSKEDTGRFYQSVEQEANRGLNVTKMAELHEATSGFVFMGDNESAEVVSQHTQLYPET